MMLGGGRERAAIGQSRAYFGAVRDTPSRRNDQEFEQFGSGGNSS